MENFTPVSALIGGLLIGLSAVLLLGMNGRIAGISGIVGSLWRPERGEVAWRIAFIVGLLGGALGYRFAVGAEAAAIELTSSWPLLVVAGLLVGFGTRLGSGCTSGHGVCGLARLSPRSLTATSVFILVAAITVFIARHVVGG